MPGLWMPAALMTVFAARLSRAGYATHRFGYWGRDTVEANVERLARYIDGRCVHLVGHSLGGVLVFDLLRAHPELHCGSVVLLGSPVRGCYSGRRLGKVAVGRWMLGNSAPRWNECDAAWRRREPLGVIAGTRPLGLGRALGALPGENDGVVRVEETAVDGMREQVLLPMGHSWLPLSQRVASMVDHFLKAGRFA